VIGLQFRHGAERADRDTTLFQLFRDEPCQEVGLGYLRRRLQDPTTTLGGFFRLPGPQESEALPQLFLQLLCRQRGMVRHDRSRRLHDCRGR